VDNQHFSVCYKFVFAEVCASSYLTCALQQALNLLISLNGNGLLSPFIEPKRNAARLCSLHEKLPKSRNLSVQTVQAVQI